MAARLALGILSTKAGDVHLRAFAFFIFYVSDLLGAFEYIRQNAASCEPHVFGSMLDAVTDDVGLMGELKELPEMVQFLLSVIRLRGKSELRVTDKYIKAFLRVYGLEESAVRAPEKKR